jgi:hypothetical protein
MRHQPPPRDIPLSWIDQWPAPAHRSALAQIFYAVIRRGEIAPPAIIEQVIAEIHTRLTWTTAFTKRQFWHQVLNTLADDPQSAKSYAAEIVAIKLLPVIEKAARKRKAARKYMTESMRGKPTTDNQRWLIRRRGYAGDIPEDRAEASALIDRLLHGEGL